MDLALPSPAASAQPKAPNPSRTHPHRGSPLFRLRRQGADLVDGSSTAAHASTFESFCSVPFHFAWGGPLPLPDGRSLPVLERSHEDSHRDSCIMDAGARQHHHMHGCLHIPSTTLEGGDGCVHIVPAVINCATYIKTLASYFRI